MRDNEKRMTLAVDGETYKEFCHLGVDLGMSHQAMMEAAVKEYIAKVRVGGGA